MTTELKRFAEAYATMTVAVYEPIIVRWFSNTALWAAADAIAKRTTRKAVATNSMGMTAKSVEARTAKLSPDLPKRLAAEGITAERVLRMGGLSNAVEALPDAKRKALLAWLPALEVVETALYQAAAPSEDPVLQPKVASAIPVLTSRSAEMIRDFDVGDLRNKIFGDVQAIAKKAAEAKKAIPAMEVRDLVLEAAKVHVDGLGAKLGIDFLPVEGDYIEALSPIGLAHFYRQLYFNAGEGAGPIEEAFTIAPGETLEVVYENVRRQIHEELTELGSEVITESAVEEKNLEEVSDKVSSLIQRDSSAAMSASATVSASGGIGVWSASASATFGASADMKTSTQRSSELASRRLKDVTKRASERITKTFTVKTRDVLDVTTTNVTRRVIKNDQGAPVSYGLRRVYRRVKVKVQSLGPRLVWQLYLRNPGTGLARSKFVHFMDSQPIADRVAPPATRPRPEGGTDTGTTSTTIRWDWGRMTFYVALVVRTGSDRKVTAVSIDSITDLEGGGKEDYAPSARNDVQWSQTYTEATNTFQVNIGVLPGDAASVQVGYSYVYEPGPSVLEAWEREWRAAQAEFERAEAEAREKALREQFERDKALLTERSKIRARPAGDLRREERYEVMNRMVSHLFERSTAGSAPSPLEIELFHRYFDIEGMFVYTHPSWWKPRYSPTTTGLARPAYEITADSEPASMGSSLGWLLQLDGDTRRNEFLNSPWVRVCLPIRPAREREATAWLAAHVEGDIGYKPTEDPLKSLLAEIKKIRENEDGLGVNGPDYVTVDSTVGAPGVALKPENVYPVVDEFEVTVPTDGFVYDEINVSIP